MADDDEGAYVFITGGKSYLRNACQSDSLNWLAFLGSTGSCSESSPAFRAGFGYQYTPTWGLEVSYGSIGYAVQKGQVNFPPPPIDIGTAYYSWQLRAVALAVQAVATLHMGDNLAVFGKVGLARVEYDERVYAVNGTLPPGAISYHYDPVVHTNRNAPALGAGVRLDVTPHGSLLLLVESFGSHDVYSRYGQTAKVQPVTASFGLMYRY